VDRHLGKVRLADRDGSGLPQPPHHLRIGAGRLREGVGAVGGQLAGKVDRVLDRERHPEQRPLLAGREPRLGLLRLGQRPLGEHDPEGVQLRVEPLDPLEMELDELARGDLAAADQLGLAHGAREGDLLADLAPPGAPHGHRRILDAFGVPTPRCTTPGMGPS
jgi:hypothetical protein